MFEAIHGSAPDIAGKSIANPSGLINAAVMMLTHIGQNQVADKVKNAWLSTLEAGYHTADIYQEGVSRKKVSTQEFADEVISRLGELPTQLPQSKLTESSGTITIPNFERKTERKELVGVDVFLDWPGKNPNELGTALTGIDAFKLKLKMITNRGVKVFPDGLKETYCTDHWRCRFVAIDAESEPGKPVYKPVDFEQVVNLIAKLHSQGFDVIKTENLYEFDGNRGFSLGQGE
jgi:isocitrate dehydrogenase